MLYKADFVCVEPIVETMKVVIDFKIEANSKQEAKEQLTEWFAIQKGTLKIAESDYQNLIVTNA